MQSNPITPQAKVVALSAYWSAPLEDALKARCVETYPVEFHRGSDDFKSFANAVNQGIDSHLEAIHFKQSAGECGRIAFAIEPQSVPVLIRRLMQSGEENAEMLAGSICSTLDIELI